MIRFDNEKEVFVVSYEIDPKKCNLRSLVELHDEMNNSITRLENRIAKLSELGRDGGCPSVVIDNEKKMLLRKKKLLGVIDNYIRNRFREMGAEDKLLLAIFDDMGLNDIVLE